MAGGLARGLTVALPRGRTLTGALALLQGIGFDCQALAHESRKLLAEFPEEVRELAAELIQRLTAGSRGAAACAPVKRPG